MKKFSLLLAAALLAVSLVSCGGDEGTTSDTTGAADTAADTPAAVEAEPETTEEVTTAEPEPEMVEVFTPVAIDNFDSADDTAWKKNAQLKEFDIADGYLYATSVGGDPSIATKADLNLNCADIHAIRVRYLNGTASDAIQVFFTTDTTTSFCEEASFRDTTWNTEVNCDRAVVDERTEDEWDTIVFYTEDNALWTGTLADVRIDLSNGEGAYLVDFISFDAVSYEEAAQ